MKSTWTKSTNQYFGELFEIALCNELDINTNDFKIDHVFSKDEIDSVKSDAKCMGDLLRQSIDFNSSDWFYCARSTVSSLGDLSDGSTTIELKYFSNGSGTYHNTSINYLNNLGIESYHDFLNRHGYYQELARIIPDMKANTNSNSPFSNEQSHIIRHTMKSEYAAIEEIEANIRAKYVSYVVDEICNRNLVDTIFNDFINKKKTSNGAYKGIPDFLAICNHRNGSCRVFKKNQLVNLSSVSSVKVKGFSITINDVMNLVIGWQNGNGLSNPTIRCFLSI